MKHLRLVVLLLVLPSCSDASSSRTSPRDSRLAAVDSTRHDIGLNDVSILYPLPAENVELLPRLTIGEGDDDMVADRQLRRLPNPVEMVFETLTIDDIRDELKIVGIRLDPCFRDVPNVGSCRPQLRLVVQAILKDGSSALARDLAMHLFYELKEAELYQAIDSLIAARSYGESLASDSLSISPSLVNQGLDGIYAQKLKEVLKRFATVPRLSRIAFTFLRDRGNAWQFGALDIAGDDLTAVVIPGAANAETVTFSMGVRPVQGFLTPCCGSIRPTIDVDDNAAGVVRMAKIAGTALPDLAAELPKLDRIENPKKHGPGTVDCASCHVAMVGRTQVLSEQPDFSYVGLERFLSDLPLTPTGNQSRLSTMRAFGYSGDKAIISQRTVNETAAIVESLRSEGSAE